MSISARPLIYAAVIALASLALGRAAAARYQEKERAITQACREQLQKLGITRDAAKAKYPTPEVGLVSACLLPGSTGDIVVKGRFVADTKLVFENDHIEVVKESLAANEYRATVKIAANIGPEKADVVAISPVSGIFTRSSTPVKIGGRYEWNLDGANGWRVVARSAGKGACGGESGDPAFEVQFFRAGQAAPFEKREASLYHSPYEGTYRLSVSDSPAAQLTAQQEMMTLMQKMADPKLPAAEREKIMASLEKVQVQMQQELTKMTDPAYQKKIEEARRQFGCTSIELKPAAAGFAGQMRCAQAVGTVALTGTLKLLGQ